MKKKTVIHIIFLNFIITSFSHAQNYIGVHAGYSAATLLDYSLNDDYSANYTIKSGVGLSVFYEGVYEENVSNYRVELQYQYQEAGMEVDNDIGGDSFYKDMDFSFHQLNLNLSYLFPLIKKSKIGMSLLVGATISVNMNTRSKGNGVDYVIVPIGPSFQKYWEKDERNSKDLTKLNCGVNLGLEFLFPMNDRLDFLVQNKYYLSAMSAVKMSRVVYTPILTGQLNLGLRYRLGE